MSIEVRVPSLPESVADATVLQWHKQPGEPVGRDDNLVDLETDKVVLEVAASCDGVLTEICLLYPAPPICAGGIERASVWLAVLVRSQCGDCGSHRSRGLPGALGP